MTPIQRTVFVKVTLASLRGERYRAEGSGERVTLASLWRHGLLERWAWRGHEGERDAAHEYALTADALKQAREVVASKIKRTDEGEGAAE
jgi:hypothetical protein